jgi:hypothetical protein
MLIVGSGLPAHYLASIVNIFKKYGKACPCINGHSPFRRQFPRSFEIQINLIFIEAISAAIFLDFAEARGASHMICHTIKIAREKKITGPTG